MKNIERKNIYTIEEEIRTAGHHPLKIIADDFNSYICKNGKGVLPPYYIINEFLANVFLECWNLPTPDCCMLDMDLDLLNSKNLSVNHQKKFYSQYPSFGSKYIENVIEVSNASINDSKKFYNQIVNPINFINIALFDIWLLNDDRKNTNYNLLFKIETEKSKTLKTIYAIDHSFLFESLAYNDLENLPKKELWSGDNHLLVSELGMLIKKYCIFVSKFDIKHKTYFLNSVERCLQEFDTLFSLLKGVYFIEENTISILKSFIFDKEYLEEVYREFQYRMNQ